LQNFRQIHSFREFEHCLTDVKEKYVNDDSDSDHIGEIKDDGEIEDDEVYEDDEMEDFGCSRSGVA